MEQSWPQLIIQLIELLLVGGGLVAIVTISDKKAAATLENISKIGETYTALQDQMKENYDGLLEQKDKLIETLKHENTDLKEEIEAKDKKISEWTDKTQELYQQDGQRVQQIAQLKIMNMRRCDVFNCTNRKPPLEAGIIIDKEINRKNLTKDDKGRFHKRINDGDDE